MKIVYFSTCFLVVVPILLISGVSAEDSTQWKLPDGAIARLGKGSIYDVKYFRDGSRFAVASSIGIWIHDTRTGEELALLNAHKSYIYSLASSPDGDMFTSGDSNGRIFLWDAHTGQHKRVLIGHTNGVTSLAFSPDGKTLASVSYDWDARTGLHLRSWRAGNPRPYVKYSPEGDTLAFSGRNNSIFLADLKTGEIKKTLVGPIAEAKAVRDEVTSIAHSSDGNLLAGGSSDNAVYIWDTQTGQLVHTLIGHTDHVFSITFSPDGKTIASSSGLNDRTIRLWDPHTGKLLRTITSDTIRIYALAFSPDGKTLASTHSNATVGLWDPHRGELLTTFSGHTSSVGGIAYSPDGKVLASSSRDGTILLWDLTALALNQ